MVAFSEFAAAGAYGVLARAPDHRADARRRLAVRAALRQGLPHDVHGEFHQLAGVELRQVGHALPFPSASSPGVLPPT